LTTQQETAVRLTDSREAETIRYDHPAPIALRGYSSVGKTPATQLARFLCNLFIQSARDTPFAMQRSNCLIAASIHKRLIGGGILAAAFFADFLADFFEAFFALGLVAIKSDSL